MDSLPPEGFAIELEFLSRDEEAKPIEFLQSVSVRRDPRYSNEIFDRSAVGFGT